VNGHTAVVVASNPSDGSFTIMSENDPENSAGKQNLQVDVSGAHNGSVDFHGVETTASWLETGTSPSPSITAVSPGSGYVGTQVTITGTNLAGATSVSFNGATASIASDDVTQIVTSVPIAATTGSISVTTPSGTATSPFTVVRATSWSLIGVTGNEEIYAIDSAGHAWEKWYSANSGTWSDWFDLGTPTGQTLAGKPSVWISPVSGNEEVFARDTVGNYWEKWYTSNSGVWSPWTGLGSPGAALISDPAVIEGVTGNEDVYGVDSAGHAWEKWYSANSGTWSDWFDLGAPIGPLTITTTSPMPSGTKGVRYSATLTASGGTAPYSWIRISGKLPPRLKLNTHTGIISGKPRKRGTYSFTVSVTDQSAPAHQTATQLESISIA
jgi:hypothetical protein